MWHTWLDGRDKICRSRMTGFKVCLNFESYTGADIILTPMEGQLIKATFQDHLDAGAIMIQVKNGRDLDASIMDGRLQESILRMSQWECSSYQCGLLITGLIEEKNGSLHINHYRTPLTWGSYLGALNSWTLRGGCVYPVIQEQHIQREIDLLASKAFTGDPLSQPDRSKPRKKFKSTEKFNQGMTLTQRVRLAKKTDEIDEYDLRHLIVNIEGVHNKDVVGIWNMLNKKSKNPNIETFIEIVKSDEIENVKGIGKAKLIKIKKQLGL